jgi:hypothetical protein
MTSFVLRILGVSNGYGGDGNALVFGRRVRCEGTDGKMVDDAEIPSCTVRIADVPRRAYVRVREDATDEQLMEGIEAIQGELGCAARAKITDGMNNSFGDVASRGYGRVRCLKVFLPRKSDPLPDDVGRLSPVFCSALCTGATSAAEELAVSRRLRTGDMALVEDAAPMEQRCTTAKFEYRIAGPKSITGLGSEAPMGAAGWTIDAACIDVRSGSDGEFALSVAFARSSFAPFGVDDTWAQPAVSRTREHFASTPGDGAVAAMTAAHEAIERVDPDIVAFRSLADVRALQAAAEATGISAIGFVFGMKQSTHGHRSADRTRRGICLLSDWGGGGGAWRPDGSESMAREFDERCVAWSSFLLARELRATLFDVFELCNPKQRMPRLADRCLLATLRDHRIVAPDRKHGGSKGVRYEGGLVIDVVRGLHRTPVYVVDFRNLYPSVVAEYGICFTNRRSCRGPGGAAVVDEDHRILPTLVERFAARRGLLQLIRDNAAAAEEAIKLKLAGNATIGKLGQKGSVIDCVEVAAEVTECGRCTLEAAIAVATKMELPILGGDTDSLFIGSLPNRPPVGMRSLVSGFVAEVNSKKRFVMIRIDSEVPCMLLVTKKQYAYVDAKGEVAIKGLEMKKRDYPPITAACCMAALRAMLLEGRSATDALAPAIAAYGRISSDPASWVIAQCYKKSGGRQIADVVARAVEAGAAIEQDDPVRMLYVSDSRGAPALISEYLFNRQPSAVHLAYCAGRYVKTPLAKILSAASGRPAPEIEREIAAAIGLPTAPLPKQIPAKRTAPAPAPVLDPYAIACAQAAPTVSAKCPDCGQIVTVPLTPEVTRFGTICPDCVVLIEGMAAQATTQYGSAMPRAVATALCQAGNQDAVPDQSVQLPFATVGMKI